MILATGLMATAAVGAEVLHRRLRRDGAVHRLAGITVLRIALVSAGMAMPSLLVGFLRGVGL